VEAGVQGHLEALDDHSVRYHCCFSSSDANLTFILPVNAIRPLISSSVVPAM